MRSPVAGRHRALGDARVLWAFVQALYRDLARRGDRRSREAGAEDAEPAAAARRPMRSTRCPKRPGVYLFYGLNALPLYIGKSRNLRERVGAHFSSDYRSATDLRLSAEIRRIEFEETAGEIGALLRESALVKSMLPAHNHALRRKAEAGVLELPATPGPPRFIPAAGVEPRELAGRYGPFTLEARRRARRCAISPPSTRCAGRRSASRSGRARASRARCGAAPARASATESAEAHHARLARGARAATRFRRGPSPGSPRIRERALLGERTDVHVLRDWCWLGTARDDGELDAPPRGAAAPGVRRRHREAADPHARARHATTLLRLVCTDLIQSRARCVRGDHVRDARGQLLRVRNVQEFVRTVRVRLRAQHAGDEELRVRKMLAQHRHERNRAALAHRRGRLAVEARATRRRAPPRATARSAARSSRSRPGRARSARSRRAADRLRADASAPCVARSPSTVGGSRSDSLSDVRGRSTLPAFGDRRQAVGADDRQRRPPRAVEQRLGALGDHRLRAAGERILARSRSRPGCRRPRAPAPRARRESAHGIPAAARGRSRESSRRSSRLRAMRNDDGTTPLASPECTPSVSTSTVSVPAGEAAQRRRRPQPLVVAAAGIEADDEIDRAHARREVLEIRGQIVAAALLAGLDQPTQRACGMPCACSAPIAASDANTA